MTHALHMIAKLVRRTIIWLDMQWLRAKVAEIPVLGLRSRDLGNRDSSLALAFRLPL